MKLRTLLFWLHLITGVIAGLVIAIMSFTGAALAFEKQIVAWAERDVRQVTLPSDSTGTRLSIDELQKRFRVAYPETRASSIVLSSNPSETIAFTIGREKVYYANPYTGEFREPRSTRARDFMRAMEAWHRWLGRDGNQRASGRMVTGACNAAFLGLGVTGLILWWPRGQGWRALKPSFCFVNAKGKTRDWNWHNVIGFWSLPALIVITASGVVMSFRWANNLVYTLSGDQPPTAGAGAAALGTQPELPLPAPGARPVGYDALVAKAQDEIPSWQTITLQLGGQRGQGGPAAPSAPPTGATTAPRERTDRPEGSGARRRPQPVSVVVRGSGGPLFATTSLTFNPFTGERVRQQSFSDLPAGRRARTWFRFLHTGEALGPIGQLIGGLACVGGVILVYTGFALALRRLLGRQKRQISGLDRA